jgi:hypothetical protein
MVDPVGGVGAVQDTLIFPGSDRGGDLSRFSQGRGCYSGRRRSIVDAVTEEGAGA